VVPLIFLNSASGIQGGQSALGSLKVLTLATTKEIREPFCSMALLSEDVVVTAAHCLEQPNTSNGILRFNIDELWVTYPGIDIKVDNLENRVKVSSIKIYPGYASFYDPSNNDFRSQENDIALILLKRPLVRDYKIEIASAQEVASLIQLKSEINIYGYGYQHSYKLNGLDKTDGKPYSISLLPRGMNGNKRLQVIETSSEALCPGDSGGPWYSNFDRVPKMVAVNMTGSGCETNPPGQYYADGTLIYPYLDFINSTNREFDILRAADKAAADKAAADKAAADKAAADKAAADKAAADKAAAAKKSSIKCVKGKLVKKVIAIKPLCPKGYKKK
jgi:secreted trypsin-like serine protease